MPVYLDHNATTPVDERVLEAMLPFMAAPHGNPSSMHRYGRHSRAALDNARAQVAALVNAQPAEVIFTAGGTEANNLAIQGVMACNPSAWLMVGTTEHSSVLAPADRLSAAGRNVAYVPVNSQGLSQIEGVPPMPVSESVSGVSGLMSVMWANAETGVLQPVKELANYAHKQSALFHCDAVQGAGKVAVDFSASGADLMTISSHKIYGPKGVGALLRKKPVDLVPQVVGGGQEKGYRAGTENVAAIVGFGKAAELANSELQQRAQHCLALREALELGLAEFETVQIMSAGVERLPNTVQMTVAGFDAETLIMEIDRCGVAVSSGSACGSGSGQPSHVLTAMGVPDAIARGAVRVSFGMTNTEDDVAKFLAALRAVMQRFGKA